ncbi:MAG: O-antigen ligase family protein [Chloroflexi bacterium]|nr:O-antigen ligase family protein [Chloroflexota bacterium]MCI0580236.1 O-antigen ligase family protein [Chloroflexota bacterium]MCI0646903.1 O-antigen ligase family protein [Chloroflexota bacterium]MCI0729092.1 O-antigen ligase family protein [Chloroflexota bacterium]
MTSLSEEVEKPLSSAARPAAGRARYLLVAALQRLAALSLAGLVFFTLVTPSWRYGPFAWLPLWRFAELAGGPVELGILNFLPVLLVAAWLAGRWLNSRWQVREQDRWQWGLSDLTLPFLGLTILGVVSLIPATARLQFIHVGGLALAWLVYLYVANEAPDLTLPLAAAAVVQGAVAVAQFLTQKDLGLAWLGELPLNPLLEGNSVIWARDHPWLRAYGLTAHPNFLGAILATLLLFFLPALRRASGWRQTGLLLATSAAFLGLVTSFSRSAGLAFLVGALTWLYLDFRPSPRNWSVRQLTARLRRPWLLLPLFLAAGFLLLYGDLISNRLFVLDTPTEAQSISQREKDYHLALEIIARHPWFGVGLGNYTDHARMLVPDAARVHNVALLVTAELGFPGLFFLLWLTLGPLVSKNKRALGWPPWLAMLVIGLFDTTLWLTGNWQTAILFGLLAANWTTAVVRNNS